MEESIAGGSQGRKNGIGEGDPWSSVDGEPFLLKNR